jgi:hypothetical protein
LHHQFRRMSCLQCERIAQQQRIGTPPGPPSAQLTARAVAIETRDFLRKSQVFSGVPAKSVFAVTAPQFCTGPQGKAP